ncbi:hypothetical protein MZK47_15390 [Microbacterium aerolatum]|uniref:hypothetical protein n=2 Tax=Actinomycetota TaxID=201174 RepID=UPI000AFC749B|nr:MULTISPECIES: hypothetical protein [Microbacterium]MCK3771053.1 hypothetical protein [Microbacterium aerolatum]
MMARPRYKRTTPDPGRGSETPPVPVVLPQVVITVAPTGTMTVTVDGEQVAPEPFAPAWRREDFARVLDQLTEAHRSAVRVEVREADGTVFTDIITPGSRRRPAPDPASDRPAPRVMPELVVLRGEGFVPGEDVAIAVVIAHGDAAPDGTMRALLTGEQAGASPTREVILLGRVSGTLTIGHPG